MPSASRLSVVALLTASLAAHGDEAVRQDGGRVAGRLLLSDAGRFTFRGADRDEPVANLDRVRFAPKVPAPPPVPLWHQLHLGHGEVILAEVRKLDATHMHVRPDWAETLAVPRTAVERVSNMPGWRPVLFDAFDDGLASWTKTGEPRTADGQLVLDRARQAVEVGLKPVVVGGRVVVTFRSAVTTSRRVSLELGFERDGKPAVVRVELVGPGEQYTVTAPAKPEHAGKIKRTAGTHRLSVEFDRDRLAIFVDELVLWAGDSGPDSLRSVRLIAEGDGTEAVHVDDVLVTRAEPAGNRRPWADLTADAVRSPDGDETFGTLAGAGSFGVTLDVKGKKLGFAWADTAEFTFRRGPAIERATSGEHIRVRVRTADGVRDELVGAVRGFDDKRMLLAHPVLGELTLPRDRIEEVQFLFHGRRVPVDAAPHHLGARPAFGFAIPKPEGLRLVKSVVLDGPPAAGFVVVRLREDDLPPLAIDHPRYLELRVYSAAPRPRAVMEEIRDWLASQPAR